jgi:hypothetical protein
MKNVNNAIDVSGNPIPVIPFTTPEMIKIKIKIIYRR